MTRAELRRQAKATLARCFPIAADWARLSAAARRVAWASAMERPVQAARCYAAIAASLLSGCSGSLGNIESNDPTERGLSYVACAIVTAAIIRAFFNK